jgi:hypothetical protein
MSTAIVGTAPPRTTTREDTDDGDRIQLRMALNSIGVCDLQPPCTVLQGSSISELFAMACENVESWLKDPDLSERCESFDEVLDTLIYNYETMKAAWGVHAGTGIDGLQSRMRSQEGELDLSKLQCLTNIVFHFRRNHVCLYHLNVRVPYLVHKTEDFPEYLREVSAAIVSKYGRDPIFKEEWEGRSCSVDLAGTEGYVL